MEDEKIELTKEQFEKIISSKNDISTSGAILLILNVIILIGLIWYCYYLNSRITNLENIINQFKNIYNIFTS